MRKSFLICKGTENAWSENTESCLKAKEEKFKKIAKINKKNQKQ